jgi:hypothetical protein
MMLVAALGAAAGCDTVDLGAPPADINACRPSQQFFIDTIWPMVLSADYSGKHCYDSSCHSATAPRQMTLTVPPASEIAAIPLPPTWAQNYMKAADQMNCADSAASALIRLPESPTMHGGGRLFAPGSMQETALRDWVTAP